MSKNSIDEVIASIRYEAIVADDAYGDSFDKKNTINDWIVYVVHYLSGATKVGTSDTYTERYTNLVKAGGLIINALRRLEDVPPRHYDSAQGHAKVADASESAQVRRVLDKVFPDPIDANDRKDLATDPNDPNDPAVRDPNPITAEAERNIFEDYFGVVGWTPGDDKEGL